MTQKTDKTGRTRRATCGAAGPKHLPVVNHGKASLFDQTPPQGLGDVGAKWWKWAVGELLEMGTIASADHAILEKTARSEQRYANAEAECEAYGDYVTVLGVRRRNPALMTLEKLSTHLLSVYSSLGLTPSARAKFGATKAADDDPFADLLARRKQQN